MSILIWNIQGIAATRSAHNLKNLCSTKKTGVLILVEPQVSGEKADGVSMTLGFECLVRVEAVGRSGGIELFWNSTFGSISVLKTHSQFIHCKVIRNRVSWLYTANYGSPNEYYRKFLFSDLSSLARHIHSPRGSRARFQLFRSSGGYNRVGPHVISHCNQFWNWLNDLQLADLGFIGAKFTWWKGDLLLVFVQPV
ncbi:hypothetical protein JCGZ_04927 [Jatropha curcas]|uniref:Endonuclease/exonuclease/phosphatase domain-containing protein n=1 Tax=Jatropha curcas TaxID=180498 RepID=A0A067KXU3_JATCU|nr:hypothetical protein JCGZ_04927 [Jatropha curcas]